MSGLIKIARFSYLFLYLVCGNTVFRLKYMKKIQPHTEIGKKQRSILITFSDICRFFFYITTPKLDKYYVVIN